MIRNYKVQLRWACNPLVVEASRYDVTENGDLVLLADLTEGVCRVATFVAGAWTSIVRADKEAAL